VVLIPYRGMKKIKLTIKHETIRNLNAAELARAAGRGITGGCDAGAHVADTGGAVTGCAEVRR
jgi:hypothetical protein